MHCKGILVLIVKTKPRMYQFESILHSFKNCHAGSLQVNIAWGHRVIFTKTSWHFQQFFTILVWSNWKIYLVKFENTVYITTHSSPNGYWKLNSYITRSHCNVRSRYSQLMRRPIRINGISQDLSVTLVQSSWS